MVVYVLTVHSNYDYPEIVGVFTSMAIAESFKKELNEGEVAEVDYFYDIDAHILDSEGL